MTRVGRRVVKKGVQPVGLIETSRENFYLYGSIDPLNGTYLMQEQHKMSSENFQSFLDLFGRTYPSGRHIMIADGASIHWAKDLRVPENLVLLKLPPYCPELNPIERVWQHLKKEHKGKIWGNIQALKDKVFSQIEDLSFDVLYTLTAWNWILDSVMDN